MLKKVEALLDELARRGHTPDVEFKPEGIVLTFVAGTTVQVDPVYLSNVPAGTAADAVLREREEREWADD